MSNELIKQKLFDLGVQLEETHNALRLNGTELSCEVEDVDDMLYCIRQLQLRIGRFENEMRPKKVYRIEVNYVVSRMVDVLARDEDDAHEAATEFADEQMTLDSSWDWYLDNHDTSEEFDEDDVLYPDVEL
jgi:hypothetical protein